MWGVIETVAAVLLAVGAVGFDGFKAFNALRENRRGVALAWALVTPLLVLLAWTLAVVALIILGCILVLGVAWLVLYSIQE
jgi:hypothetical protein